MFQFFLSCPPQSAQYLFKKFLFCFSVPLPNWEFLKNKNSAILKSIFYLLFLDFLSGSVFNIS